MISLKQRIPVKRRFEFTSDAYADPDTFAVVRMKGFEAVSRPYRFELVLVSDDADIDFSRVLAADAQLNILAPDDESLRAPYGGMLAEFEQLHQAGGYTFYRAVLVPRVWQLMQYRNSEVYLHEQTLPQIIEAVLKASKLAAGTDFELRLRGQYRPRSYVCQYQETPLDFISRWMEKEGIYYFFEQVQGRERLVLLDDAMQQPGEAVAVNYRPADELDTGVAPDSVQNFACRRRSMPQRVMLQEFNYRRASEPLLAQAVVDAGGVGEEMLYGENFRSMAEGERYAKIRAQEILCGASVFHGDSTAVGLRSGLFMDLAHHYRESFNDRYLVTEITHEGSQAGALLAGLKTPWGGREGEIAYRNSFVALPGAVQYRPARSTPRPRVPGTLTATIDAEGSGDYAELDGHGQYKVQVPFDRTEKGAAKGSARIRMASLYAGSDHGMHFPLHKGTEVLLSFADGDPDQPVIVGAVPNSMNPSVVRDATQAQNLIRTAAGNVLRMSDRRGMQSVQIATPSANTLIHLGLLKSEKTGMTPEEIKEEVEKTVKEEIEKNEKEKAEKKEEEEAGLFFQTIGQKFDLTYGNESKINFGATNGMSVGQSNEWSASLKSELSWGFSVGVSASTGVEWKLDPSILGGVLPLSLTPFKGIEINDGDSIEFVGEEHATSAQKSVTFKAGLEEVAGVATTKVHLALMRAAIAAHAAGNMAEQLVIADRLRNKEPFDRTAEAIARPAVNLALFVALQAWARQVAEKLEDAPAISQLSMDESGIRQVVNGPGAPNGTGAASVQLVMDAQTGLNMAAGPNPKGPSTFPLSSLVLSNTGAALSSAVDVTVMGDKVSLQGDGNAVGVTCAAGQTVVFAPGSEVALSQDSFKAAAQTLSLGVSKVLNKTDLPQYVALQAERQVKETQKTVAETALAVLVAALQNPAPGLSGRARKKANQQRNDQLRAIDRLKADIAMLDLKIGRIVPTPTALLHGLTMSNSELKLAFGTGGLQISNAGLKLSLGGGSQLDFSPASVSLQGSLLKLG
jgi:type VI secretion system VgrG family protein